MNILIIGDASSMGNPEMQGRPCNLDIGAIGLIGDGQ